MLFSLILRLDVLEQRQTRKNKNINYIETREITKHQRTRKNPDMGISSTTTKIQLRLCLDNRKSRKQEYANGKNILQRAIQTYRRGFLSGSNLNKEPTNISKTFTCFPGKQISIWLVP